MKFLIFLAVFICSIQTRALASPLAAGDYKFDLEVNQQHRSYLLHIPQQANATPLPVVISLHGGGGNAQQHREATGMDISADRDGYIVVYPNGSGHLSEHLLTWNAGNCCGYAQKQGIDDVLFISVLLDDLAQKTSIDKKRIYAVGHSNGGMMAHYLGEMLPDKIAAIASVSGAHIPLTLTSRAIPVLHIHSVDDPRALYYGGLGPPFPLTGSRVLHSSVDETLAAWVRLNGCSTTATEKAYRKLNGQTATQLVYEHCRNDAEVMLWKLTGAGHGWPGGKSNREALVGPATQVIDANYEIWKFVSRFSLDPVILESRTITHT